MVLISKVIETNYISERNKMIIYSQPYVKSLLKFDSNEIWPTLFTKPQDDLLGGVFLTTQGPADTKNVLKGQINWYCHWKLIERGFGRYFNKIKNWKNQVSGFSSTQKGREKRRVD